MLTKWAARRLRIKLLGSPASVVRPMSYGEFRNWDRLVRELPNK